MIKRCWKCGYENRAPSFSKDDGCPKCGAIYSKAPAVKGEGEPKKKGLSGGGGTPPRDQAKEERTCSTIGDVDLVRELILLIRSRYGLICLETAEEERAESLLRHLADSMSLPFFIWTLSAGLQRADLEKTIYGTTNPKQALDHIESINLAAVYHFQGLGPLLDDAVLEAKLVHLVRSFTKGEGALVLTGTDVKVPEAVKPHTAWLSLPPPARQDYAKLLLQICEDLKKKMQITVAMGKQSLSRLVNDLSGLTLLEAEKVLTKAIIEDGKLSPQALQRVLRAKKSIVEREGLLEYFPVQESLSDIADLARLKKWLIKRKAIIQEPDRAQRSGLTFPKGILLLGVPGSGKSLCAKAVAMEWGLPLLKMDPSSLYNKYIGETEKNFKRAMQTAEKMSPVVLWIDEIEKILATGEQEDGGVSLRVLGMFLSWLQDRKGDVFVVATSNDIERLRPEPLRKGRFDEIFFLDLPHPEAREAMFRIHLKRRGYDPGSFDLSRLAAATEDFSGAEIEQVVVAALYTAFSSDQLLSMQLLLDEADQTQPLARTRSEYVESLRAWAKERTVSAQ